MPVKLLARIASLILALGLLATLSVAQAMDLGSAAWTTRSVDLLSGPGTRYQVVASVEQGDAVVVTRCSDRWCLLDSNGGWISIDHLSFGQTASGPISGPKFNTGRGGPGEVCFHDGVNFSGTTVCQPSGAVARDLALLGWDNRISSVSIDGNVSVNLCRDRNFTSYCVLVDQSTANLDRLLQNSASSWQVW